MIRHAVRHHPGCDVLASIEAGATGHLLKDAAAEHIAASIHELHAGGSPITPSIARRVLARCRQAGLDGHRRARGLA